MASSEVSIDRLPVVAEIVNGDFLIVQSPNATSRLNYQNFVVGLDNTTFKSTINDTSTGLTQLSSTLFNGVTSQPGGVTAGDLYGIPLTIKDTSGATHTFQILLSTHSN
tara:strand:+ start:595 stop:921 length:327 start_codon:yes stop_codon:yes gene_type:complete